MVIFRPQKYGSFWPLFSTPKSPRKWLRSVYLFPDRLYSTHLESVFMSFSTQLENIDQLLSQKLPKIHPKKCQKQPLFAKSAIFGNFDPKISIFIDFLTLWQGSKTLDLGVQKGSFFGFSEIFVKSSLIWTKVPLRTLVQKSTFVKTEKSQKWHFFRKKQRFQFPYASNKE